jgi:DNA-binding NarL/FixJ family response regulator
MDEAGRLIAGREESPEVAFVESYRAVMAWVDGDPEAGVELGWRAREMALRAGDRRTAVNSLVTIGSIELRRDPVVGRDLLEQAVAEGRAAGYSEQVARALNNLGAYGATAPDPELADAYLPQALEYCVSNSEDLWRINVLAVAARNALDRGRWTDAADFAEQLLQDPRESPWPHHEALIVLALVRARRGDPGATAALDEAAAVGVPPDEEDVHVDLAAARAEVAWLEQRPEDVAAATSRMPGAARLSLWRTLAGLESDATADATGAYALALSGAWEEAAAEWERLSFPYEAALALMQANDEDSLRQALVTFQELGALPAAQVTTRRLRALGAKGVTRGPRRATRENAAGLTPRECEVLGLLAEGRRNAEIAQRLYLSRRTVDHHVSALLRKLDAGSRVEAVAAAQRLGVL